MSKERCIERISGERTWVLRERILSFLCSSCLFIRKGREGEYLVMEIVVGEFINFDES